MPENIPVNDFENLSVKLVLNIVNWTLLTGGVQKKIMLVKSYNPTWSIDRLCHPPAYAILLLSLLTTFTFALSSVSLLSQCCNCNYSMLIAGCKSGIVRLLKMSPFRKNYVEFYIFPYIKNEMAKTKNRKTWVVVIKDRW